ncbi:MAG: DNA-binding phage protein [Phenylobacterium sp.]|jgi:DNA-binding phage protein
MLTSNIQYNAAKRAAQSLQAALQVETDPNLSAKLVAANRSKIQRKLDNIEKDIAEFQINRERDISKIPINSLDDMLTAPILYRIARNESIVEFANQTGISKRQILRYEAEQYKNCSIATLQQIFTEIGLSIEGTVKTAV